MSPTQHFTEAVEEAMRYHLPLYADGNLEKGIAEALASIKSATADLIIQLVGEDDTIEERNYILDECADDWQKGRNALRAELRTAANELRDEK